jgi:pimeloyl-ACP methyl ester carboxylesterase
MDFDPVDAFARVRAPVLLFYGEDDEWSPIEDSVAAWRQAAERSGNRDVTVVRLPATRHHPTAGGVESLDAISALYERELLRWLRDRLSTSRSRS